MGTVVLPESLSIPSAFHFSSYYSQSSDEGIIIRNVQTWQSWIGLRNFKQKCITKPRVTWKYYSHGAAYMCTAALPKPFLAAGKLQITSEVSPEVSKKLYTGKSILLRVYPRYPCARVIQKYSQRAGIKQTTPNELFAQQCLKSRRYYGLSVYNSYTFTRGQYV